MGNKRPGPEVAIAVSAYRIDEHDSIHYRRLRNMNANKRLKTFGPFAFVLLLAAALPASARIQESYGYLRVLEGSADVVQAGSRDDRGTSSAEINQPVLAGDRLRLADRSHAEVVLADRNLLRIDGGSDLVFE